VAVGAGFEGGAGSELVDWRESGEGGVKIGDSVRERPRTETLVPFWETRALMVRRWREGVANIPLVLSGLVLGGAMRANSTELGPPMKETEGTGVAARRSKAIWSRVSRMAERSWEARRIWVRRLAACW